MYAQSDQRAECTTGTQRGPQPLTHQINTTATGIRCSLSSHVTHSHSCLYLQGSLSSEITSLLQTRVWRFTINILKDGFNNFSYMPKGESFLLIPIEWMGLALLPQERKGNCLLQAVLAHDCLVLQEVQENNPARQLLI